jgi:hypothetical protein
VGGVPAKSIKDKITSNTSNYFLWQDRRRNKNRSKTLFCKKTIEVLLTEEQTDISIV